MKKRLFSFFMFVMFTVLQIGVITPTKAAEDFSVKVVVQSYDKVLAEGTSAKKDILEASKEVMDKTGVSYKEELSSWGGKYISEISGIKAKKFSAGDGWLYAVNRAGEYVDTFAPDFSLKNGDKIIFYYGAWGTLANKIEYSTTNPNVKTEIAIWNFDSYSNSRTPISGVKAVVYDSNNKVVFESNLKENKITFEQGLATGRYKLELSDFQLNADPKVVNDSFNFTIESAIEGNTENKPPVNNPYDRDNTKLSKNVQEELKTLEAFIKEKGAGDPWAALSLSKLGEKTDSTFIKNSALEIKKNNGVQEFTNTDIEKLILVLASSGYTPYSFMGYDLASELYNRDMDSFLMNDAIYGLIAYNYANIDGNYKIKREQLVDYILSNKLNYSKDNISYSGWALAGDKINPDMTGLAISALAPYYSTNSKVKAVVDSAVESLSKLQTESGYIADSFGYFSESIDMVILGLTSVGVNPEGDKFLKSKGDLVSALLSFKGAEGQYKHSIDGNNDYISTEQALRAFIALKEFKEKGSYNYYSSNIDSTKLAKFELSEKELLDLGYLPQTGSRIDFITITVIGILLSIVGAVILKSKTKKI
jgi:LPXTG-motif cell wall-anchored protein